MDLDSIDCPQYVCFGSESCQDSQSSDNSSSKSMLYFLNHLSPVSSEENFVVHKTVTGSKASKLKTKTTIPVPFQFETDGRLKSKRSNITSKNEEKDFKSQLRQHKAPQSTTSGVTKVEPFNLTEAKKRKREEDYLPLAEQINAFQKKTPKRYHTSLIKAYQPPEHWSPPKLRPRTPNLQAVKRHRVVEALSREEQEAKLLEEMKAYQFHAQPVDPRVYKPTLIEKTETKILTKAKDIELQTAQRMETRHRKTSEKTYKFRARPVPKSILAGPVGLGEKPKVITTKPKSPSFTTENRLKKRKLEELHQSIDFPSAKKTKIVKKIPPAPLEPIKLRPTVIQPFSFDKTDKQRFELKNKRIQEEIQKENQPFVFRAQLLPSPKMSTLPRVQKKPPTQPQPFNFCTDYRNLRSFTVQEEKSVSFKAQPATVLHKEPFIPQKPPKESIEFHEFSLHTDRRASERLKLKEEKEAHDFEMEQKLLAQKALEEERERQEILKLRRELVHKANPVPNFKPMEAKPSSKPLTEPVSPKFETAKRLRSRYE